MEWIDDALEKYRLQDYIDRINKMTNEDWRNWLNWIDSLTDDERLYLEIYAARMIAIYKKQEYQPMSEWLKEDAVRLDLPNEEIIVALCEEIEKKNNVIEKQRVHFGRIVGYTENYFDNVPAWKANQIAKEALKLTE